MKVALLLLSACALGCVLAQPYGSAPETEALPTIGALLQSNPTGQLATLATAAQAAGLLPILSDPAANFTVFAPTDQAFTQSLTTLGITDPNILLANSTLFSPILSYHVVQGAYSSSQLTDGQKLNTLNSDLTLKVIKNDTGLFVEGEKGGPVPIVTPDILASNGVVHLIGGVLIPSDQYDLLSQRRQGGK